MIPCCCAPGVVAGQVWIYLKAAFEILEIEQKSGTLIEEAGQLLGWLKVDSTRGQIQQRGEMQRKDKYLWECVKAMQREVHGLVQGLLASHSTRGSVAALHWMDGE
jgi:hypothetical protein